MAKYEGRIFITQQQQDEILDNGFLFLMNTKKITVRNVVTNLVPLAEKQPYNYFTEGSNRTGSTMVRNVNTETQAQNYLR